MIEKELVRRFANLFRGNQHTFGRFHVDRNPAHAAETIQAVKLNEEATAASRLMSDDDFLLDRQRSFINHLKGDNNPGIGIVPIMEDSTCWFAGLDIDAHGDDDEVDLISLEKDIRKHDLPLTVCRSKSGGAHCYLFGIEPLNAELVRRALTNFAKLLGYGGCEIFPKQTKLAVERNPQSKQNITFEGKPVYQKGSWLNLCYYDSANNGPLNNRYCVEGGKRLEFSHFVEIAESRRISNADLNEVGDDRHKDAPPCVQKMISDGIATGSRNEAMYSICVYLKQAFPEDWRDHAFDLNTKVFDKPMTHNEAKKVIASAARRDYRYKCKEEPCKSLCNSDICVKRKFGISGEERGLLDIGEMPAFDNLRKVDTDPVRWMLAIADYGDVTVDTKVLFSFNMLRERIAEQLTRVVPPMKNDKWHAILHKLMENSRVITAPKSASAKGQLEEHLTEFLGRADIHESGEETENWERILHGTPCVVKFKEERYVAFRGTSFKNYLAQIKFNELKGPDVYMAVRPLGVEEINIRIAGKRTRCWALNCENEILEKPEFQEPNLQEEF